MRNRKDTMKPVESKTDGPIPFSDFSKQVRITTGFGANNTLKESPWGNKIPPMSKSELIKRGFIKN